MIEDRMNFLSVYCTTRAEALNKIEKAVASAYDNVKSYHIEDIVMNPIYTIGGKLSHFEFDATAEIVLED